MAPVSKFKNANKPSVTTWEQIYEAPVGKAAYFIQIDVASKGTTGVQVSVRVWDDSESAYCYQVKNAPLPVGSTLQVLDGQKLVLEELDRLEVQCDTSPENVDVITSLVEDVNN